MLVWIGNDFSQALHSLYTLFFLCLGYDTLRPLAACLLFRLTRRSDVAHFRIRALYSYHSTLVGDVHIAALLQLYKQLRPDAVVLPGGGRLPTRAAAVLLKLPDPRWFQEMEKAWVHAHPPTAATAAVPPLLGVVGVGGPLPPPPLRRPSSVRCSFSRTHSHTFHTYFHSHCNYTHTHTHTHANALIDLVHD
jgi:hypothetical protein